MSTEEKFYKVFKIKPRDYYSCSIDSYCPSDSKLCDENCPYYVKYKTSYPEITSDILLELICIYNYFCPAHDNLLCLDNIETLKDEVLSECIRILDKDYKYTFQDKLFKKRVYSLFKGVKE